MKKLKVLGKFKKKKIFFFWGGGQGGWVGGGGGVGSGRGGLVWGVRVDVNEELKFLGKFTKKKSGGGVGSGVGQVGVRLVGGGGSGWM